MKTIILHIETGDVPADVVEEEIEAWLDDLKSGAWTDRYATEGENLDFGYRIFSSLEDAQAWESGS